MEIQMQEAAQDRSLEDSQSEILNVIGDLRDQKWEQVQLRLAKLKTEHVEDAYPLTIKTFEEQGKDAKFIDEVYRAWVAQFQTPRSVLAYCDFLANQDRNQEIVTMLQDYLPQVPLTPEQSFQFFKALGNVFLRLGDPEAAEEYYNKAFAINSESDVLMVNYGMLEIQRRDWERARQWLGQALQIDAKNAKAWIGLALVYRQLQDYDMAWANLLKASDLDPSNEVALNLFLTWGLEDQKFSLLIQRLQALESIEGVGERAIHWQNLIRQEAKRELEASLA